MGIKRFYSWFKKHDELNKCISPVVPSHIDHLLIDMNSIIHSSAQYVYKYGKYAPCKPTIVIPKRRNIKRTSKTEPPINDLYDRVKLEVNKIIETTNPQKSVYLAIDGVAPMAKQNQQRQRRYLASINREGSFDSTCITAGTNFMKNLSLNLHNKNWISKKIEVTISDDLEPGEGEHKLMAWIRNRTDDDTYCVVGSDADLILLCAVLKKTHVYIMRESEYININKVRLNLPVSPDDLIIFSCFIGNDFLPSIPSFDIKESNSVIGALDFFFDNYNKPLVKNGYLNVSEIIRILKLFRDREQSIMEARALDEERFPNPLWKGDIEMYRKDYLDVKIEKSIGFCEYDPVRDFMKTVQWVYLYYKEGTTYWDWFYPYHYALHADIFVDYIEDTRIISYSFKKSLPSSTDDQLLRVIPFASKNLLPLHLHDRAEKIAIQYPRFKIDNSGKREEWEAITIVDFVNLDKI
jgi:5'-3' exonuclease